MMNAKDLKKVKSNLTPSDIKSIAKKHTVTDAYVRYILNAKRFNNDILESCIALALKRKLQNERKRNIHAKKIAQL